MRPMILKAILTVFIAGLAGCDSGAKTGPVDATKPAPVEPPADGFVPKSAPK